MTKENPQQYATMSTDVLKAMSHPIRRHILTTLGQSGPARAADLAERLGEPANRLSFHLRTLASAGLIEEAPELARDKRDRVWKTVGGARTIGSPEAPMQDRQLGMAVMAGIMQDHQDLLARVAAYAPKYSTGEDPTIRGTLTDYTLRLSRPRFEELLQRINEVVDEFREDARKAKEAGTETDLLGWNILLAAASEEI
ncbi:MAG: ArsR/SmtB family transcription factor [Galactobacter sp.]|uniref:ArsR/SmtB family transcription factor n=1 Tax=Galactobacter sp. TaxID=2676125 RepID=UPI0025C3C1E0|nr:helix-turn-helix domain-containing protein [Galactobacter sp.]